MKTLKLAALMLFAVITCRAEPTMTITNFLPGYAFATNGWTSSADGIFIPLTSLPLLTASNAVADGAASDIRRLMYGINEQVALAYLAMDSTNRPTDMVASKSGSLSGAYLWSATHQIQTKWNMTPTLTPR